MHCPPTTLLLLSFCPCLLLGACEVTFVMPPDTATEWSSDDVGDATPDAGLGECAPVEAIGCGMYVWGDSSDPNSGHTTVIDGYPIAPGNFDGPEIAWEFVADRSGEVTWRLDNPTPTEVDHDLFVLAGDGACRADRALARGPNSVTFDAWAGERYYLLLDGFDGDAGLFDAQLVCEGDDAQTPAPEPADPCADVRGLWDTDPLDIVAVCTTLEDGAHPDGSGVVPSYPLEAGALCLARGVYGLNNQPYYVLSGTLDPITTQLPSDLHVSTVAFVGSDEGSTAVEGSAGVDVFGQALGVPIIDDGDETTEARWRSGLDTLEYHRRHDGWGFGDQELLFSALLSCTEGAS